MRQSKPILRTIALGAMLAIGLTQPWTAQAATGSAGDDSLIYVRGGGGGFGGGHGMGGGFGESRGMDRDHERGGMRAFRSGRNFDGDFGEGYDASYGTDDSVYGTDDSVGYCESRFHSYDPAIGTYLGYDGFRHPCP
jgi:BA14K-like protein